MNIITARYIYWTKMTHNEKRTNWLKEGAIGLSGKSI